MHMGLVVLVKKMSVLINFLLQNTNLVSCLTGLTHFANSAVIADDFKMLMKSYYSIRVH